MRAAWLVAIPLTLAGVASGCAAPAKKTATPAQPVPSAQAGSTVSRLSRLSALLRGIERPGPVLDALPASAGAALRARLAGLDAQRKLDASQEDGPLAESMPLLHLAAGGNSPRALYALATTPAGTVELAGLLGAEAGAKSSPEQARIATVAELARRAALHFLRDRAADVPDLKKPSALVCRLIERAARTVDRRDIALAALEALVEIEPRLDNQLDLAQARARELDVVGANELLHAASSDPKRSASPSKLRRVSREIELASELARAEPSTNLRVRVRALLHLGRLSELRQLLSGRNTEIENDLGLASALAAARLGGGSCPGLPPDVGTSALCATAFRDSADVKGALALLERAWQSGQGRDDEAIEYYLAISRIVPWMHRTASALELGQTSPDSGAADAKALSSELDATTVAAPRLASMSLFVTAMSGALDLSQTSNDDALFKKAQAIAQDGSRFSEPGVLAVAALLARRRNIAPLLDSLPSTTEPSPARVALGAWVGVTQAKRERMDAARSALAEVMTDTGGASLERVKLVLSMAEGDAALDGSERAYQVLSRVAGQLLSESIPPDLAFRAVLDTAGSLSRGGRRDRALEIMHDAASAQVPAELQGLHDLWRLVKGYERVLERASSPTELAAVRKELTELSNPPIAPSTQLWLELWSHEFDARLVEAKCPRGSATCAAQARKLRRIAKDVLAARVGREAAPLIERGCLPGGSVNLAFGFSAEDGLTPLVNFDPAFSAVELPKIETY
ncbi:MAG TPA: hypothetical protein VGI10_30130 [Polyangiaceae bacterium]|jgi:hypothetical protein